MFCADKYHLMKYINKAAGRLLDEKDIAKEELLEINMLTGAVQKVMCHTYYLTG